MLLHGFPSSSREFDSLIPLLAGRFHRDVPHAQIHLLDAGHFALDEQNDEIARLIIHFLAG